MQKGSGSPVTPFPSGSAILSPASKEYEPPRRSTRLKMIRTAERSPCPRCFMDGKPWPFLAEDPTESRKKPMQKETWQ